MGVKLLVGARNLLPGNAVPFALFAIDLQKNQTCYAAASEHDSLIYLQNINRTILKRAKETYSVRVILPEPTEKAKATERKKQLAIHNGQSHLQKKREYVVSRMGKKVAGRSFWGSGPEAMVSKIVGPWGWAGRQKGAMLQPTFPSAPLQFFHP